MILNVRQNISYYHCIRQMGAFLNSKTGEYFHTADNTHPGK
jgi:hypothetical protein